MREKTIELALEQMKVLPQADVIKSVLGQTKITMELNKEEKEVAYSLLSDISDSTGKLREYELRGIVKTILMKKYNLKPKDAKDVKISFSGGQIEIAPKTVL